MKQIIIDSSAGGKAGTTWFPLVTKELPTPSVLPGKLLVQVTAGALNHRDVFQRQNAYPSLSVDSPVGADGVGVVTDGSAKLKGKRVLFTPGHGWESDPAAPEGAYGILGGQTGMIGTLTEYTLVDEDQVELCPEHLTDVEAAALPLAGLTAFRALFTKGQCKKGSNILITGIGGGVALYALQFAVAAGANVWVTSGSEEKLAQAKKLGAKGGINYKTEKWGKALAKDLSAKLDLVIDSAGGNIVADVLPCLKPGSPIVAYGMTTAPKITISMAAILANVEYRGSTMGSKAEFRRMLAFVAEHKIRPVVHKVYIGLDAAEDAFVEMRDGKQFGKLVITVNPAVAGADCYKRFRETFL
ncbi:Putative uncharacterized protein [Taphrina deformans PYCC 5710]|uniref:Enoyl reductase (ER) domain-containing protein n=1 Tax=Taphrina deformans (strain PYCC 5710 / ATCC 11124 / CBS 356.35 / IMI 108563 / JCM 9778 / NBRC 8474) TaxID=1097556 RepID=R4X8J1_TAPDE|nr:Putative uncharacterized protein [Taphrina deformans PYCC 5710]|eukprot:CCG81650.1 Putative uncharacterized protein [Taphrina deformans PYCC 5710]